MPSTVYNGSFGVNAGGRGLTATATGSALPEGARILSVSYTLKMSAEMSSSKYRWVVHNFAVGGEGGSPYADYETFTMSSHQQTISGGMNFDQDDVEQFRSSNINVYAKAYTNYEDVTSYMGDFSITVEYEDRTGCGAPTKVTADPKSAAPGNKVTLSWNGAEAGKNNAITGYQIYRATHPEDEFSYVTTVGSSKTYGSAQVDAPATNGAAYYYKVRTLGSSGNYNSELSTAYATVTCAYSQVGAPAEVGVDVTNVAPGAEATLFWSGATEGSNNAITGYQVYRAESADGTYEPLGDKITTDATSGSLTVNAPTESGEAYYYKVQTLGTTAGSNSAISSVYASLGCTYSAPTAPNRVTVNGAATAYAYPGNNVVLSWSGASAGANNAITGYDIYRNGAAWKTGLAKTVSSYSVPAHDKAGNAYTYTVVTRGAYSDSSQSKACTVYAFTDPTAPTAVNVSEAETEPAARVTLSWSGATAGSYNAIQGYNVYRSNARDSGYSLVAAVEGNVSSIYVDAPYNSGDAYYYRVETVATHSNSGRSTAYASVTAIGDAGAEDTAFEVEIIPKPPRKRRGFIFGDYDTAADGWTLASWSFPEPAPQTTFVAVPGRAKGPLDMSTALTDGDPTYGSRSFTATFELSEGTRDDRDTIISYMVNRLHGRRVEITFPDDPARYAIGRLSVKKDYSDPAHAAVTVTATCDPWRYSKMEHRAVLLATVDEQKALLSNTGRCVLVPDVELTGYNANVTLTCGDLEWTLDVGTYRLPELKLPQGNTEITYKGTGTLTITYREAIL